MANELALSLSLGYEDAEGASCELLLSALNITVSSKKFLKHRQNIGTSEEALALGEVASLGWFAAINRDPTNFVSIKTGTGGTLMVKLKAGEACVFRFGSGVTAPFAIADTGACDLEYMLVSN